MQGIYIIKNLINNKVYVGQSCNIEQRIKRHKHSLEINKHGNEYLQNSWNKYGKNNFEFIIIEECDKEQLNEKEIYCINYFDSLNRKNGFNIREGGYFGKHSEETRNKISKNLMGEKNPNFGKATYWKGKHLPNEIKEKIRKAQLNHIMPEKTKIALKKSRIKRIKSGKYFSDDVRHKLSEIHKGKEKSQEHKQKISKTKIEKKQSLGEKNGMAKINEKMVKQIVVDYKNGLKESQIIKKYNLTRNIVSKIIGGQTWTYITGGSLK